MKATRSIYVPRIEMPRLLSRDETFAAIRAALEPQLELISKATREILYLPRLEELPEDLIDLLANEYHVDNYDLEPLTLEVKIELIRTAILDHRLKGTAAGVEKLARHFFRTATVREWFEYGGDPYRFQLWQDITSDDESADASVLNRLRTAVNEMKNARSWLEYYGFRTEYAETVAAEETHLITVDAFYDDWYDYRRVNAKVDGGVDFGKYFRYTGKYGYGGKLTHRGFEARGDYGQNQASDFEELNVTIGLTPEETIPIEETNLVTVGGLKYDDSVHVSSEFGEVTVRPLLYDHEMWLDDEVEFHMALPLDETMEFRDENTIDVRVTFDEHLEVSDTAAIYTLSTAYDETITVEEAVEMKSTLATFEETVDAYEENLIVIGIDRAESVTVEEELMPVTVGLEEYQTVGVEEEVTFRTALAIEETVDSSERGSLRAIQKVTYGGRRAYDGSFGYCGEMCATYEWVDDDQLAEWKKLRDELNVTFEEECATCGSAGLYAFELGSVRLGNEQFLLSDPQVLTCLVRCASCGGAIAEFLVKSDEWEVFL